MRIHPNGSNPAVRAVEDLTPEEARTAARLAETRRLTRQSEATPAHAQSMDAMARLPADEAARKHLREIEKVGQRGAALARQLLAFSGRQVLHPKIVQLNHLLTGMEDGIRRFLGPDVELRLELHPDLDRVLLDPEQFEHVVMNLVSNARDVMPDGGHLTLETVNLEVPADSAGLPLSESPGRYVLLKVSDSGPGMPESVRQHAFEPFFSTKGGMEITGLGLSTAYGIVAQSGGQILTDSAPGRGTGFHIYLPAENAAAEGAAAAGPEPEEWETLLLVEDEDNVRQPLAQILANRGYNVLAAADALEAIQISQAHAGPIHLMITDILMDGLSGVELAERLAFQRPEMRVLFATGYPAGLTEGAKLGGDANLLKKPFSGRELVTKLREILAGGD
jgi:two-component system cell cycle sensor histidine kinase/response regulator CckA